MNAQTTNACVDLVLKDTKDCPRVSETLSFFKCSLSKSLRDTLILQVFNRGNHKAIDKTNHTMR